MSRNAALFDTVFSTRRSSALIVSHPAAAEVSLASACLPSSTLHYNARHLRIIAVNGWCWNDPRCSSRRSSSRKFVACRAFETSEADTTSDRAKEESLAGGNGAAAPAGQEDYPSGELEFHAANGWQVFLIKLKMLIAWPWQRVKKGSILKMKISGEITEQLQDKFQPGISLPQICQNLIKAAHDPRIAAVIVQVEPLSCGWPKVDEICRHIEYYKQSGKPLVGYLAVGGEKEYYLACSCGDVFAPPGAYISLLGLKVQAQFVGGVLEKIGVQPQIERIGKYKSVGDLLSRKDMSDANREMLTAILDDVYENWLDRIASVRGKTTAEVENLLEEGIFEIEKLHQQGWISDVKYEDQIEEMLKAKLQIKDDKSPKYVDYRKYSRVREWTLGLSGGKADIAVLRAVGNISRQKQMGFTGSGISSDAFIEQIRQVREAKNFKAVVLRIDSPGGDALASDLMWRELRLLAAKKPVIASMVDVAASGGYYMAMAAGVIVAERLTLTGSIGVVTGKLNLGKLYERVGFTKEVISRGKFAELDAEQRPFRPEEAEFFGKSAKTAYKRFRDTAALSRSMQIEKMEEVAQGRVWTGKAAAARGLVDTLGGFSKAVAIAKQKAGISLESKVKLVELSRSKPNIVSFLRGGLQLLVLLPRLLDELNGNTGLASEIRATMDNISVEGQSSEERTFFELLELLLR
ncbi:serine protease SPPA, chloroplastic isoform X1 [Selaginella moellendorffii]|uniref:serine protease SPPA, chloroplastic isoform X1 n=1 Tax=Selaginella moellendorffii TaxID=88036 RepID=UPI000D1CD4B1|nr:serine protease SPPA, chloroplastic isoform X1 [Selaginella moellendorffii]XP_024545351.1 serine protease SPPA, chloroplastic isoform X1 [Selaginella moellendorffii]|eukprot:XP_024545350.1 serine protease SPPA, chloroplastic isoform X1 [Selaginella moellendorffii]